MDTRLLSYYEAIEQASADMLNAAKAGDWDQVVKLEGACVLLISQLKHAARQAPLDAEASKAKSRWCALSGTALMSCLEINST